MYERLNLVCSRRDDHSCVLHRAKSNLVVNFFASPSLASQPCRLPSAHLNNITLAMKYYRRD